MERSESLSKNSSLKLKTQQSLRRLGLSAPTKTEQKPPVVVTEKRNSRKKSSKSGDAAVISDDVKRSKREEHRIDIGDEQRDLLGYEVFCSKLSLIKGNSSKNQEEQTSEQSESMNLDWVDAKLTSKALVWNSELLHLEDVVALSYCVGLRRFTVHAYQLRKGSCGLLVKSRRSRKDLCFFASTSEDALQWVNAFAEQHCYVNSLPHPMASKKQSSDLLFNEFPPESYIRCKSAPKMLVILNPRSGRGRSSKVFHGQVEPILKLAGFDLEVVKTTYAGHARKLAASVDFSTCPDGIICVGGDGIINEVLNGLLSRDNKKEAISVPIGIVPAGSDNSLIWTVLGLRDPVSAAVAIVKGGLTATDVLAVEWVHAGAIHFGTTVAYFGFVSDVLELSEKYQKRFGPLRYFVAGFLKFFCLPKYSYEVEYLPSQREKEIVPADHVVDISELYTDVMRRSSKEGLQRASSLSSIDSLMSPSHMSVPDIDNATFSSTEPSEFVRAIDAKSKRQSSGRLNFSAETEVIHPQLPHLVTPTGPKTRSKSRTEKGRTGYTSANEPTRSSWGNTTANDKEDISSTMSDPGPLWDSEPRWDTEPNWDVENRIELPGPPKDAGVGANATETSAEPEENWVVAKGQFLGVLVCNHSCKTVQSLRSQVVAPLAEHDDNCLDLLLVHGSGRLRLLRFLLSLQVGKHTSLPYVEYIKVRSVKIKPGKHSHNGCGIDGELFPVNGQVVCSLFQEQCRLIGRSPCPKT